jgi:predicted glycosyltransferase involved in capsule biosynthesis
MLPRCRFTQANYHRENANWLKLELIADMMAKNEAEYLLFLDADVVLCVGRFSLHVTRIWLCVVRTLCELT